jgi:hypothetical protein
MYLSAAEKNSGSALARLSHSAMAEASVEGAAICTT